MPSLDIVAAMEHLIGAASRPNMQQSHLDMSWTMPRPFHFRVGARDDRVKADHDQDHQLGSKQYISWGGVGKVSMPGW